MSDKPRTIEEYRTYVKKRQFTQNPSYYEMRIFPYDGSEAYVCYPDSIILPGRNFINTPFSYYGPEFALPLKREYNELSVNFIVFQDWKERSYFEKWMDEILPYDNNSFNVPPNILSDILPNNFADRLRNIQIGFFKRQNNPSQKEATNSVFIFLDAYPILITPTSFESSNSGYTLFTVNFVYKYYTINV